MLAQSLRLVDRWSRHSLGGGETSDDRLSPYSLVAFFLQANIDLRLERPVHGAFAGDLHQEGVLRFGQRTGELNIDVDSVQHSLFRFAVGTILRMNPGMAQRNGHAFERNLFFARIQPDGHGRACAQTGEKIIIRVGRRICSANTGGLIDAKVMFADGDFLKEAIWFSVDDYVFNHCGGHMARRCG